MDFAGVDRDDVPGLCFHDAPSARGLLSPAQHDADPKLIVGMSAKRTSRVRPDSVYAVR